MKIVDHSIDIDSPISHVWTVVMHWEEWTTWDGGMESIVFPGPVAAESIGKLKLKNGPAVDLHISNMVEGQTYTSYFEIAGTRFVFHHHVKALSEKITRFQVVAEAEGPTALILGNIARGGLVQNLPLWMATFKTKCLSLLV